MTPKLYIFTQSNYYLELLLVEWINDNGFDKCMLLTEYVPRNLLMILHCWVIMKQHYFITFTSS